MIEFSHQNPPRNLTTTALLRGAGVLVACVIAAVPAWASQTSAAVNATVTSMAQAEQQGARIFATDSFNGKRMFKGQPATCDSCHTNGGRGPGTLPNGHPIPSLVGAAAQFPRFIPGKHKVITLQEQLAHCIRGGLQGTPPAFNSPQMVDLEVYLDSLSKGSVMGKQFK